MGWNGRVAAEWKGEVQNGVERNGADWNGAEWDECGERSNKVHGRDGVGVAMKKQYKEQELLRAVGKQGSSNEVMENALASHPCLLQNIVK